jgi:hypothetical protein
VEHIASLIHFHWLSCRPYARSVHKVKKLHRFAAVPVSFCSSVCTDLEPRELAEQRCSRLLFGRCLVRISASKSATRTCVSSFTSVPAAKAGTVYRWSQDSFPVLSSAVILTFKATRIQSSYWHCRKCLLHRATSELNLYATLEIKPKNSERQHFQRRGSARYTWASTFRTIVTGPMEQLKRTKRPPGDSRLWGRHISQLLITAAVFFTSWQLIYSNVNMWCVGAERTVSIITTLVTVSATAYGNFVLLIVMKFCEGWSVSVGKGAALLVAWGLHFFLRRPWAMITMNYINFRKKCELEENTVIIL